MRLLSKSNRDDILNHYKIINLIKIANFRITAHKMKASFF
jgi:hypothetical protein